MDTKEGCQPNNMRFERRKFKRIKGTYIVSYALMKGEKLKFDVSQTKDLSEGGLSFICDRKFEKDDLLKIQLRLPELSDYVALMAQVIASEPLGKGSISTTRVEFIDLDQQVKDAIKRLAEYA